MSKIKVYIDCGHGGRDSGAVNGSYYEKTFALNVGLKLKKRLLDSNKFEVRMSREGDTYCTLDYRTSDANKWGADIFISIHTNSSDKKSATGIETFCYKYKYRQLADAINNGVLQYIDLTNRGVKEGNWHVVRESKMSACLVELGFITNSNDLNLLINKQQEFANGIFKGILDYYNIPYEVNQNHDKLYIVSVGAFKDINNAKNKMEELKKLGIEAYIHTC